MSQFSDDYLERIGPLADYDPDGITAALARAAGAMVGRLDEIVEDTDAGPGYSMIFDPDRAPSEWLGWTAPLYGVVQIKGSPDDAQRARIKALPAQHEGRPAAITAAAQTTLGDDLAGGVRVIERVGGDAYAMTVVTRSQTPDVAATEAAIRSQKPIGVALTYQTSDAPLLGEYTRPLSAVTVTIATATLADVT